MSYPHKNPKTWVLEKKWAEFSKIDLSFSQKLSYFRTWLFGEMDKKTWNMDVYPGFSFVHFLETFKQAFFSPIGPKLSSNETQFLAKTQSNFPKTQTKFFLKLSFSENVSTKHIFALLMKFLTD